MKKINGHFMSTQINHDQVSQIIRETAAKLITPRYKQLREGDISSKTSPNDLVTIADKEAEVELERRLTGLYPGSVVVGEEGVSEGRVSTSLIGAPGRVVWVVDPVDGTYNFVHGNREFGVLIACVVDGETRHGWLYDIIGDSMTATEKGGGTYRDGARQSTAAPKANLTELQGHAGVKYFPEPLRDQVKDFRKEVGSLYTLSCACHEYLRLLGGESDFGIYSKARPWDHMAGMLAVREAGGVATRWDGGTYDPVNEGGGVLVASSRDVWTMVHRAAVKKMDDEIKKTP